LTKEGQSGKKLKILTGHGAGERSAGAIVDLKDNSKKVGTGDDREE